MHDLRLYRMDGGHGVGSIARDHHTACDLRTALVQQPAPCGRSERDARDILHTDRHIVVYGHHGLFQIADGMDIAQTAVHRYSTWFTSIVFAPASRLLFFTASITW